jgi:hypothetical protein
LADAPFGLKLSGIILYEKAWDSNFKSKMIITFWGLAHPFDQAHDSV